VNKRLCGIEACDGFVQLVFTPSVDNDVRAFLQKAARRGCANTRPGPRHDDDFPFESIHDFLRQI
jgi:hypothetical protein